MKTGLLILTQDTLDGKVTAHLESDFESILAQYETLMDYATQQFFRRKNSRGNRLHTYR